MNLLNNPWVVGIGTGILSGLLVTWILSLFISKKKDREHQQQISSANRDVIYSVRAGIPENSIPSREVFDALIHSTARRYDLEPSELYQPKELSEELIKEVMDSSFLSAAKKVEYCSALIPLGEADTSLIERNRATEETHSAHLQAQRRKMSQLENALAVLAGLLSAVLAGTLTASKAFPNMEKTLTDFRHSLYSASITVVFTVGMIGSIFLFMESFLRTWTKRREAQRERREQRTNE
jgi:hypothetical protein